MIAHDTNVLIYACDQRDPRRHQIALDLIVGSMDGVLLWQVACEFVAAARKLAPQGFTPEQAWNRLNEFIDILPLVTPTRPILQLAQKLHLDARLSFWDAAVVASAREAGVQRFYSEDLPGIQLTELEIINPF